MLSDFRSAPPSRQRGATLIILLITLVVIVLLALSNIRSTVMDERMAGNARDRNKAFQAAEAAVQACLAKIDSNDLSGIEKLQPVEAPGTPVWDVESNWNDNATNSIEITLTASGLAKDSGLAKNPRCMVETLSASSYRVTGRGVGGSESSVVVLQATYSQE